jgi:hypothetical protein
MIPKPGVLGVATDFPFWIVFTDVVSGPCELSPASDQL